MNNVDYILTEPHSADAPVRGRLADLVLDAHLIPPCGLIPPFAVLRDQLRAGGGDGGMSPGCKWMPFELIEADYLETVAQLEVLTPEDLEARGRNPRITGELRADYGAGNAHNWREWMDSLIHRGLIPGGPFRQERR